MRIAITRSALLAAAALCLVPMRTAHAQVATEPSPGFFGNEDTGPNMVATKPQGKQATNAITIIYDNLTAPAAVGAAISSTDLAATWGDELFTTGTGLLSTNKFTLYNSSTSAGALLTATVNMTFFDAGTSAFLGGYSTTVNFGTGLPAGFFSTVTVTGLDPLIILLNTTDILELQTVTAKTGTANRLGVAISNPVVVGASPAYMYISALTVGPAGFYNLSVPANPGYQIGVAPPPVGTASKSWSQLKKLYR